MSLSSEDAATLSGNGVETNHAARCGSPSSGSHMPPPTPAEQEANLIARLELEQSHVSGGTGVSTDNDSIARYTACLSPDQLAGLNYNKHRRQSYTIATQAQLPEERAIRLLDCRRYANMESPWCGLTVPVMGDVDAKSWRSLDTIHENKVMSATPARVPAAKSQQTVKVKSNCNRLLAQQVESHGVDVACSYHAEQGSAQWGKPSEKPPSWGLRSFIDRHPERMVVGVVVAATVFSAVALGVIIYMVIRYNI